MFTSCCEQETKSANIFFVKNLILATFNENPNLINSV